MEKRNRSRDRQDEWTREDQRERRVKKDKTSTRGRAGGKIGDQFRCFQFGVPARQLLIGLLGLRSGFGTTGWCFENNQSSTLMNGESLAHGYSLRRGPVAGRCCTCIEYALVAGIRDNTGVDKMNLRTGSRSTIYILRLSGAVEK